MDLDRDHATPRNPFAEVSAISLGQAGDLEAKVGGLIATYRHHLNQGLAPPPIRQIVTAVCEQVARDIEASCSATPAPCSVCSHFAAIARGVSS